MLSQKHPALEQRRMTCKKIIRTTTTEHQTHLVEFVRDTPNNEIGTLDCVSLGDIENYDGNLIFTFEEYFTPIQIQEFEQEWTKILATHQDCPA